jgi:hypothetical protein
MNPSGPTDHAVIPDHSPATSANSHRVSGLGRLADGFLINGKPHQRMPRRETLV